MQDVSFFFLRHVGLSTAAAILLVMLVIIELLRLRRRQFQVNPVYLTQLMNKENAVVFDIRPMETYRQGHIIHAQSSSAEALHQVKKLDKYKSRPLIIVCANGVESQKITTFLLRHGYNSWFLSGGMRAWSDANMPIVRE